MAIAGYMDRVSLHPDPCNNARVGRNPLLTTQHPASSVPQAAT
jgi:hypothetical protein